MRSGHYAHRFKADGDLESSRQNIIPIDFRPGGLPLCIVNQVVTDRGLYLWTRSMHGAGRHT
jgi:hypothetical protein